MVNAYDGFPYERIDAAHRYLQLLKPWWGGFGSKLKIVPVYQAPGLDEPYGAVMSTDAGMRLYIDRSFALRAPFHELAGQLEHEYRHHTNDTWNRLRWLSEDLWSRYFTICVDLEINSDIEHEASQFSMDIVQALANRSTLFTTSDLTRWQVSAPPALPGFAWTPGSLGLPERLSAEEYYALLKKADDEREREEKEQEEQEEQENEPDDQDENEALEDFDDEESEDTDSGDGSSENSDSGPGSEGDPLSDEKKEGGSSEGETDDPTEDSESSPDDDQDEPSAPDDDSDDEPGDPEGEDQDHSDRDEATEPDSHDDSTDNADGESGGPDDADDLEDAETGQGENSNESDSQSEDRDSSTGDQGNPEQRDSDSAASSGSDTANDPGSSEAGDSQPGTEGADAVDLNGGEPIDSEAADLGRRFEEMLADPMRQIAASEMANPADPLTQQHWMPDEEDNVAPSDISEAEKALEQLAEDIELLRDEWATDRMGPQLDQWAKKVNGVRRIKWESRFNRFLNSAVSSVKLKGQSDLSYSSRNPNQPRVGVILPGLSSYAPTIAVLQDVSGSMLSNDRMAHSQDVFTQLTRAVIGRFQSQVTWLSADTELRDVGKTSRWSRDLANRLNQGYGATNFGYIIEKLMTGDLRWQGRKIPKPDLLVICTDCEFTWPEKRPSFASKLLVVCVGQQNPQRRDENLSAWMRWDARDFLPDWLKPNEVVFTELGMSLGDKVAGLRS